MRLWRWLLGWRCLGGRIVRVASVQKRLYAAKVFAFGRAAKPIEARQASRPISLRICPPELSGHYGATTNDWMARSSANQMEAFGSQGRHPIFEQGRVLQYLLRHGAVSLELLAIVSEST